MTPVVVAEIRDLARLHGWAVGEHGSMARDIDLILVPWIEQASSIDVLASAIEQVTGYHRIGQDTAKPCGRRAISYLHRDARLVAVVYPEPGLAKSKHDPPQLDLSFIDPRPVAEAAAAKATADLLYPPPAVAAPEPAPSDPPPVPVWP